MPSSTSAVSRTSTQLGCAEGDRFVAKGNLLDQFVDENEFVARVKRRSIRCASPLDGQGENFERRFERLDKELNGLGILENTDTASSYSAASRCSAEAKREKTPFPNSSTARDTHASIGEASRSTVALYTSDMKERDIEQRTLQARRSLFGKRQFVAYQPKVAIDGRSSASRRWCWVVPDRGIRNPVEFIDLFERNGFVVEVDLCVFRQACAYIKERIDAGL